MRGIILAWAVGLGIFSWREWQRSGHPPVPGAVLGASLVYMGLSFVAEYDPARRAAVLAAWAFTLAVYYQAGPSVLTGIKGAANPPAAQPGKTQGPTGG